MSFRDRLKQYKITHWIYNLFHYSDLLHNKAAYKRYHIRKSLIASISSKDFPDKESRAWLDIGDSRQLVGSKKGFSEYPAAIQEQLLSWTEKGYLIWKGFLNEKTVDSVNAEIERLLSLKKLQPTFDHKLMFAHKISPLIQNITKEKRLTDLLGFILDKKIIPFQTINFLVGSNQRGHSDSIHMTTYPLGYLIAVWIALEDSNEDNGPLFYYPGSHRLPYLLNEDFNPGNSRLTLGDMDYRFYEDRLEASLADKALEKKEFLAEKGDVFIWHANLIHGGSPVRNESLTRKSMVIHYYAEDVIKYHEITERPSLLKN